MGFFKEWLATVSETVSKPMRKSTVCRHSTEFAKILVHKRSLKRTAYFDSANHL
jgi:hypothetical protein